MLPFNYLGILLTLILGLPPVGLLLAGYTLPPNLTIFPIPTEPGELSISWLACGMLALFIASTLAPVIRQFVQLPAIARHQSFHRLPFPWWGWIALFWVASSWILAWTRFSWFEPWQPHTFPLLWFGYILVLNALTYQRSGQCMITHQPRLLCHLFLLSAGFWWAFEYLNQYVNNWHYVNLPHTSHFEYILQTTVAFSTVLPAVLSTDEWLATFSRLTLPFKNWRPLPWMIHQKTGWIFLGLGSLGLGLIGIWPTILYPLLWISPLCALVGIQFLGKGKSCLQSLARGDWRPVVLSALAALMCGFWWELWNAKSMVHWEYTIPYVHTFKIFEMPILGYSGYIPFGLTCLTITEFALGYRPSHQLKSPVLSNQDSALT
ncbi:MAG: hypothetical protein JSU60_04110 [Nitrospirota bacterium]|nr:MAG: hypothetical protein JSU60_04110 [Nitrospirota bacterium]